MPYTLQKTEWLDDWYSLEGGSNWASIEGPAEEWLAIAAALRARGSASFKRCAVSHSAGTGFVAALWSPRNAYSINDYVELTAAEADALAAGIVGALRAAGAECLQGDFDPIHAGA